MKHFLLLCSLLFSFSSFAEMAELEFLGFSEDQAKYAAFIQINYGDGMSGIARADLFIIDVDESEVAKGALLDKRGKVVKKANGKVRMKRLNFSKAIDRTIADSNTIRTLRLELIKGVLRDAKYYLVRRGLPTDLYARDMGYLLASREVGDTSSNTAVSFDHEESVFAGKLYVHTYELEKNKCPGFEDEEDIVDEQTGEVTYRVPRVNRPIVRFTHKYVPEGEKGTIIHRAGSALSFQWDRFGAPYECAQKYSLARVYHEPVHHKYLILLAVEGQLLKIDDGSIAESYVDRYMAISGDADGLIYPAPETEE